MYQDYFQHCIYLIFVKTSELSIIIWKINIERPNAQGDFQMSKQRFGEFLASPKSPGKKVA